MNYNKLKYFYNVAQTCNFTKSAEELYVSQSAISRQIKELEDDFGVALFTRTNRDLLLTEAGQVLFDEIRLFFSKEKELYQKVRAAAFGVQPKLNIGFMGIQPAFHIPAIVNKMALEIPGLGIHLRRYNWDDIIPALNGSEIDIGLRLRMGTFCEPECNHHILDTDFPAMVVSARHPAASQETADLDAFLDDEILILSPKDSAVPHEYTQKLFRQYGLTPKHYTEYDQVESILMLIHSDAGVSLLSRFAAIDQFPDLKVVKIANVEPLHLELIWKRENTNPYIETFCKEMDTYWKSTR